MEIMFSLNFQTLKCFEVNWSMFMFQKELTIIMFSSKAVYKYNDSNYCINFGIAWLIYYYIKLAYCNFVYYYIDAKAATCLFCICLDSILWYYTAYPIIMAALFVVLFARYVSGLVTEKYLSKLMMSRLSTDALLAR